MMKKIKNKGFALVVAIFVVVAFSALGVATVTLMSSQAILAIRNVNGLQAFNIANGGMYYLLRASLEGDSDWSDNVGFTKQLSSSPNLGGEFTVSYVIFLKNRVTVDVTGTVNGVSRTIRFKAFRGAQLPGAFDYGMYVGDQGGGELTMKELAKIYGDFYYDGPVDMYNLTKLYNGTMYSESLTLHQSASVASWESIPEDPVQYPTFDATSYDEVIDSHITFSAGSDLNKLGGTLDLGGGTYYYTDIYLGGNATVNGPGTLVATGNPSGSGNIDIGNNVRIGSDIVFISAGGTEYAAKSSGSDLRFYSVGNVVFEAVGDVPPEALMYTRGNATFQGLADYNGCTILAAEGTVNLNNNSTLQGIVYGNVVGLKNNMVFRGSMVVYKVAYFEGNSTVIYDPSTFPTDWPEGLGEGEVGSFEGMSDWQEIY